ncbi:hypothetical protein Dsin_028806 [Dipteronia sinensis]|uniref:Retrotransposon gag domain-containing protein n=1 Tax=Dipteronia sinensis TaxID=43782 RepID=A0AAD9ZRY6_9ROSI|nr:hypothetical protein Dsin_028806 [Dipteronia sinensis]
MENPNPNPPIVQVQDGANVVDERSLQDYLLPRVDQNLSSIRRLIVAAINFETKPAVIHMIASTVQFGGLPSEDPNAHLQSFNDICDTFRYNGVSKNVLKLKLFLFSLRDRAKAWLHSLPSYSIITFDQLTQAFQNKYFPLGRASRLRN